MKRSIAWGAVAAATLVAVSFGPVSAAEDRQEACKAAMNARIQVCTDDCTSRALAAASNYKDTNNNVKFGCLKRCAVNEIFQMQACRDGRAPTSGDPTETNTH